MATNIHLKVLICVIISIAVTVTAQNAGQVIKSGKLECSENFLANKSIPGHFETGTIRLSDDVKPCTFSEGSVLHLDTVSYKYSNSKWKKRIEK